jgi:hypothetical protein
MDEACAARIIAIAARAEQIRTNSSEYLWVCRGIRPPLPPPDKPLPQQAVSIGALAVNPTQPQLQPPPSRPRLSNGGVAITWASVPERKSPAK